jgi:hypothetical protein
MTDPTLTLAFILSVGLNVVFYVRMRRAQTRAAFYTLPPKELTYWELLDAISRGESAQAEFNKRIQAEEHKRNLAQWDAAAETRGGDGPVAA